MLKTEFKAFKLLDQKDFKLLVNSVKYANILSGSLIDSYLFNILCLHL